MAARSCGSYGYDDHKDKHGGYGDDEYGCDDHGYKKEKCKPCCSKWRKKSYGSNPRGCVCVSPGIGPGTQKLLDGNEEWVAGFTGGDLSPKPSQCTAVIMASDARMPQQIFGSDPYNGEYYWIRNSGGLMDLRSLIIGQILLGINEILLVHNEDSIQQRYYGGELEAFMQKKTDQRFSDSFGDFTVSAVDALALANEIMQSSFIPHKCYITVAVYDVKTGKITVIPQPKYTVRRPFKFDCKEIEPLILGDLCSYADKDIKYTQVQCCCKRYVAGVGPTKCQYLNIPECLKPHLLPVKEACKQKRPKECGYEKECGGYKPGGCGKYYDHYDKCDDKCDDKCGDGYKKDHGCKKDHGYKKHDGSCYDDCGCKKSYKKHDGSCYDDCGCKKYGGHGYASSSSGHGGYDDYGSYGKDDSHDYGSYAGHGGYDDYGKKHDGYGGCSSRYDYGYD